MPVPEKPCWCHQEEQPDGTWLRVIVHSKCPAHEDIDAEPIDHLVDDHLWADWDPNERVVMRVDRPVDPALMAQALADEYFCPVNRRGQHCPFHDTMRGLRHAR